MGHEPLMRAGHHVDGRIENDAPAASGEHPDPAPEHSRPTRPGSSFAGLIRAVRPRQWTKNILVAAAPAAAGVLDERTAAVNTVLAFVAFSLAASGTYLLNDAADVEADRLHPVKRNRPIAAGIVGINTARSVAVVLVAAGIGIGFLTGSWRLPLVTAIYVAMTTSYSTWLKNVAVVDLGLVAAGFVLRTIAGAAAADVPISNWFFIVASFGSLFIVAGKRHSEFVELGPDRAAHRSTLREYSVEYLGHVRSVASGVTLVAYCLWAFEKSTEISGIPWYELSIVPFVLGMLRFALIVERGGAGAPEEVAFTDRPLQAMGLAWAVVTAVALYVS